MGTILWPKEKEAVLGMLSNREYAFSWTWEELLTISNQVEPPIVSDWSLVIRSGGIRYYAYCTKSFPSKER